MYGKTFMYGMYNGLVGLDGWAAQRLG